MGIFDGFPFKSREQMEREQKEFEKRVFPHDIEKTKALALDRLRPYGEKKPGKLMADNEVLFSYISAKDIFVQAGGGEDGVAAAKKALKRQSWLPKQMVEAVLALVKLEENRDGLEDFPTADDIRVEMVIDDNLK